MGSKIVRVGLIGCGEIAQVSHIPTLNFLTDYFQITYLCDISTNALEHFRRKVVIASPRISKSAEELCSSSEVDAVLVCNATAYHTEHALLALKNDKWVLVEKPLTSSYGDIERLQAAEKASKGRLMVGYMRRYAPGFLDAIAEIGGITQILYARVRDIIGPNAAFVEQSALKDKDRSNADEALADFGVPANDETRRMLMVLGDLGTHDLSAMREAIGMPQSTATFDYGSFPVVYESGLNQVPIFDAHIEVYGPDKIVRVNYDTPYVKGLPTIMTVREKTFGPRGEECYQERHVRTTYEDNYTVQFKAWYETIVNGQEPKTIVEDARQDVDLMQMLLRAGFPEA
ncbi:hypothetical protein BDW72DRAFT_202696 [Aspergillus terricola var. indicus]